MLAGRRKSLVARYLTRDRTALVADVTDVTAAGRSGVAAGARVRRMMVSSITEECYPARIEERVLPDRRPCRAGWWG